MEQWYEREMRKTVAIVLVELALAIAFMVIPMLFPSIETSTGYFILAVCAGALALGGMLYFWPSQTVEPNLTGGNFSIRTGEVSGSFNHIGHEFHRPPQRYVDDILRGEIADKIPRDKTVAVNWAGGDQEAEKFGLDIEAYLKSEGFTVEEGAVEFGSTIPVPLRLNLDGARTEITVGPQRNG